MYPSALLWWVCQWLELWTIACCDILVWWRVSATQVTNLVKNAPNFHAETSFPLCLDPLVCVCATLLWYTPTPGKTPSGIPVLWRNKDISLKTYNHAQSCSPTRLCLRLRTQNFQFIKSFSLAFGKQPSHPCSISTGVLLQQQEQAAFKWLLGMSAFSEFWLKYIFTYICKCICEYTNMYEYKYYNIKNTKLLLAHAVHFHGSHFMLPGTFNFFMQSRTSQEKGNAQICWESWAFLQEGLWILYVQDGCWGYRMIKLCKLKGRVFRSLEALTLKSRTHISLPWNVSQSPLNLMHSGPSEHSKCIDKR